jgi:N-acetyl-anhydromuramyl-L-alanine amidase AmpD
MLDENNKSWFGVTYPDSEVRILKDESWDCPAGKYKKLTEKQEETLVKLLKWLKQNCPDVFDYNYVLGHSEVSGKKTLGYWRKNDVGGSLSMPMRELRDKLQNNLI